MSWGCGPPRPEADSIAAREEPMPIDQADDFIQGNEDSQSEVGKYLLFDVPDYNHGTSPGDLDENGIPKTTNQMRSFLRLGAAPKNWMLEPGADLVSLVYQVGPAGKEPDASVATRFPTGSTPPEGDLFPPFIDDQRERSTGNENPTGPHGHGLTPAQRAEISAMLHTRGGWRDHTEGNRITTTRGDKIEIIEGNYKLIVMGRQTDTGQGMGWEATGNNVQDFAGATMPGASVTVTWIKEAYNDGAWLLQNSTENVYQYSRNAGNFKEENWGDLWETYVGSENPARVGVGEADGTMGHPHTHTVGPSPMPSTTMPSVSSEGLPRGNPRIIEKTWAISIESSTGSAVWRIPQIDESTWAVSMKDSTDAGSIVSTTTAGAIVETTTSGTIVSTTTAGAIVDTTIAGLTISTHIGPVIDIFVGLRLGIEIAGVVEVSGPFKVELSLGYSGSYHNFKDEMAILENTVKGIRNDLVTTANEVMVAKTTASTTRTDLAATRTELNTAKTTLATQQTQINTLYNVLSGAVMLG
jgi:hypothetical protein